MRSTLLRVIILSLFGGVVLLGEGMDCSPAANRIAVLRWLYHQFGSNLNQAGAPPIPLQNQAKHGDPRANYLLNDPLESIRIREPLIVENIWPPEISLPLNTGFSCIVIVVSAHNLVQSRGIGAMDTWVSAVESICTVQFVYGTAPRFSPKIKFPREIRKRAVFLENVTEVYPPTDQAFGILQYYYNQLVQHNISYDWYFKIDADTYVNPSALKQMLFNLHASATSTMVYAGTPAFGNKADQASLDLRGYPYCLGPATVFGRNLIQLLGPQIPSCLASTVAIHDDTEIGRCVRKAAGISCMPLLSSGSFLPSTTFRSAIGHEEASYALLHIYYGTTWDIQVNGSSSAHDGRLPSSLLHRHAFVHPFKTASSMRTVHHYREAGLMPIATSCLETKSCHQQQLRHLSTLPCVHNPPLFLSKSGFTKEECPPWPSEVSSPIITSLPAFVLNLRTPQSEHNFWRVKAMLESVNFTDVRRWNAVNGWITRMSVSDRIGECKRNLTFGEHGYRATMRSLLEHAQNSNLSQIAVFDDDVLIDCKFHERMSQLLKSPRCTDYMWTKKRGGVLMLGASMWSSGFKHVDKELKIDPTKSYLPADQSLQCYNQVKGNLGSFAFIIHRAAYQAAIDWIDENADPFDWVWLHLSRQGYIVRTAYPALFIADTAKPSTVDPGRKSTKEGVSAILRWNLRQYCW